MKQQDPIYFADVYERLSAPFEETHTDVRGGVTLTYITGEQCVSRLNEVLGVAGWSFKVLEHGIHAEADECWALGELTASFGGVLVIRQQFGSQKIKRSRASGTVLDIGFDLKGATTDCMKKCASLIGVGLYLSHKEAPEERRNGGSGPAVDDTGAPLACEVCGAVLQEARFRDGTLWTPMQLAGYGRRKHNRQLCMTCYRAANDARKRAEAASDDTAFS